MKISLVSRYCLLSSVPLSLWVASSLLPTPGFLLAAGGRYEVREVRPHVFVWIPEDIVEIEGDPEFSRAGTAGFIVTPDGVVVIDSANTPFHGREIYYEIGHRTDAPVKYVVDTDSEGSHTLGNEVFVDEQAVIISTADVVAGVKEYQKQLTQRLQGDWRLQARMRGIHLTLPSRTFEREMRLDVPGEEIRLVSLNAGDSDAAVYLPQSKVLFLGNLFENGFLPTLRLILPRRDIRRWIQTLGEVERWNVDIYVPGNGPPGGKQDVARFRQFLEWLADQVETRVKAGKSLDQVKAELLPQVEGRSLRAPELAAPAIEAVYQQLATSPGPPPIPPPATAPGAVMTPRRRELASGSVRRQRIRPEALLIPCRVISKSFASSPVRGSGGRVSCRFLRLVQLNRRPESGVVVRCDTIGRWRLAKSRGHSHALGAKLHPDLKTAIALQQVDQRVTELDSRIAALPAEIKTLESQLSDFLHAHEERKHRLAANQRERKELEGEIQSIQARISKHKDQLYQVKTNDQYKAMLKEIETEEREIRKIEDRILEEMLEAEELQKRVAEAAARLEGEKARVAGEVRGLEDAKDAAESERRGLLAHRQELATALSAEVLELYERVRKGRQGLAVARVRDGFCIGCHVMLRPQRLNEVRLNAGILTCESCQRILYYVEPAAEALAEPTAEQLPIAD